MIEYFAIIIDLVKSKKMTDSERYEAQEKLKNAINIINLLYKESIVKSMSFSAGDSVQGLFNNVKSTYNTFYLIQNLVFPYSVRCGIGQGQVNEQLINRFKIDDSNAYDGKAYHLARSGLDLAREHNYQIYINSDSNKDFTINSLINDDIKVSMTLVRQAIYSIMNIIDPVVVECNVINSNYNDNVIGFIMKITGYYKEKSRVRSKIKDSEENEPTEISESEIKELIELFQRNSSEKYKTSQSRNFEVLSKNDSTISSDVREILVKLTNSTNQNVSSMIRTSKMDELRRKCIAKLNIVDHFYGGNPL